MYNVNPWVVLGATVVGIITVAGTLMIEHLQRKRTKIAISQSLAEVDRQMSRIRHELDQLKALQKQQNERKHKRRKNKHSSSHSTATSDEYVSVGDPDSSDLEFFDLSDDEVVQVGSSFQPPKEVFEEIDSNLDQSDSVEMEHCIEKLKDLCIEYPECPELLWRIGKAHYNVATSSKDVNIKLKHLNKGIEACRSATSLDVNNANSHKWSAILIGSKSELLPLKEKIVSGYVFKEHVDEAIRLNPSDSDLHHLLGRFSYEIASLKWYERKIASTLFADPPNATYEEALNSFLEAEKLSEKEWKENKLYVAKSYLASGDTALAITWLNHAKSVACINETDAKNDAEIQSLLNKYNSI